jgi:hypothetical protein
MYIIDLPTRYIAHYCRESDFKARFPGKRQPGSRTDLNFAARPGSLAAFPDQLISDHTTTLAGGWGAGPTHEPSQARNKVLLGLA